MSFLFLLLYRVCISVFICYLSLWFCTQSFNHQSAVFDAVCGHAFVLGMCSLPRGESFEVVGAFNRWISQKYPKVEFKIMDIMCLWKELFKISEDGIASTECETQYAGGAWHTSTHTPMYSLFQYSNN